MTSNKKSILVMHVCDNELSGGCTVLIYICKLLKEKNMDVKLYSEYPVNNNIFVEYTNTFDIENTIVIYPEGTRGNPLNAKYVVRWILAEMGKNASYETTLSWNKNDLCYYFLSEKKIKDSPEKIGSIYKFLTTFYLKPNTFINYHNTDRKGYCHTFRKSHYHKNLQPFHPNDSVDINGKANRYEDLVVIFNTYKYFICYDPACFLVFLAGLCGCIPILHKVENVTKEQYFTGNGDTNSLFYTYYQTYPYTNYPGVAYGIEDLEFATKTIDLLPDLLTKQIEYMTNICVDSFIEDMNNFDKNINTIENNY